MTAVNSLSARMPQTLPDSDRLTPVNCETVAMTLTRSLAVVGIVAASVLGTATAKASPAQDDAFLSALDKQGIIYPSPDYAIRTAKEVCTLLDDGANGVDMSREVSKNSGIPVQNAGFFVGASIAAYCPSHRNAF